MVQGMQETSLVVGVVMILVAIVYYVIAIQTLLVLPKYFVQTVPLLSTQDGRILQSGIIVSLVALLTMGAVNNRMAFAMTAMAAAATSFILIAVYLSRVKNYAFMSNLQSNGVFAPVVKHDGRPFTLWCDKIVQTLYYFSIILAVLMVLGMLVSVVNMAADAEACKQIYNPQLRNQARSAVMGTSAQAE